MSNAKNAQLVPVAIKIVVDQISEGRFNETSDVVGIEFAADVRMNAENRYRLPDCGSDGLRTALRALAKIIGYFDDITGGSCAVANSQWSKRLNAASIS